MLRYPHEKIVKQGKMLLMRGSIRDQKQTLVFTNGCFDILHAGHVKFLTEAAKLGDFLCVGLNSDLSVRANKGPTRPINNENDRAIVLAALEAVDFVVIFEDPEPKDVISRILPDVLVKGKDWAHYISGGDEVKKAGGRVVLLDLVPDLSTTGLVNRIKASPPKEELDKDRKIS